ncbi:MAG: 2-dehydropantoate 2-reductase [Myxococcota bacterium]|jgi:2-dehydropantoate 2-reductase
MQGSKIAVIGIGAIGGSIAADLADLKRHELSLCSRTPFESLEVTHPGGTSITKGSMIDDPKRAQPADWILLATKAHQSESARPWLDALSHSASVVVVLQNGVDHQARIDPLVGNGVEVLPCVVGLPAEKIAPGKIKQMHNGGLTVPSGATGDAFAALFEGSRTNITVSEEFITQAYWKLLNNAALGGVCALALRENGVASDPEVRELVLSAMAEVMAVGRAEGADLPDDAPERALRLMLNAVPNHWSSITVDRREGRAIEWEARNAVVGKLGRRHGIATPINDVFTTLLRAADERLGDDSRDWD